MVRLGYTRLQLIVLTHKYRAHYLFLNSHGVMRIGIQAGHLELKECGKRTNGFVCSAKQQPPREVPSAGS